MLWGRLELPYNIVGEQTFVGKSSLDISGPFSFSSFFVQGRDRSLAKDDNLISEALFSRLLLPNLRAHLRSSKVHESFGSAAEVLEPWLLHLASLERPASR